MVESNIIMDVFPQSYCQARCTFDHFQYQRVLVLFLGFLPYLLLSPAHGLF